MQGHGIIFTFLLITYRLESVYFILVVRMEKQLYTICLTVDTGSLRPKALVNFKQTYIILFTYWKPLYRYGFNGCRGK